MTGEAIVSDGTLEYSGRLVMHPWLALRGEDLPDLRALAERGDDEVQAIVVFGDVGIGGDFEATAQQWAERVRAPRGGSAVAVELQLAVRRRWADTLRRHAGGRLGVEHLIGHLELRDLEGLAVFDEEYNEGLRPLEEAACRLAPGPFPLRSREPGPAYFDRHGGLAALERALVEAPGVLIVGAEGSGRSALVEAWRRRLGDGRAARRFNVDNAYGGPSLYTDAAGEERVTLPTAAGDRGIYVLDAWMERCLAGELDPHNVRMLDASIAVACAPARRVCLVLVVDDAGLERLVARLPRLEKFAVVRVPPLADDELLPVWVCQIPALEDHARRSIYLPQLVRTLGRRAPGREFVLTDVADVLERSGLPESHWRRWYGRPEDKRLGALWRWLGERSELVPDVATLCSLQALERALTPGQTSEAATGEGLARAGREIARGAEKRMERRHGGAFGCMQGPRRTA